MSGCLNCEFVPGSRDCKRCEEIFGADGESEVARLRAEVERLTRERDDARALLDKSQDDERLMIKEQDRLKAELRELRRKCGEWAVYIEGIAGNETEYRMVCEMREEAGKC